MIYVMYYNQGRNQKGFGGFNISGGFALNLVYIF